MVFITATIASLVLLCMFGSYCYLNIKRDRFKLQQRMIQRQHRTQGLFDDGVRITEEIGDKDEELH